MDNIIKMKDGKCLPLVRTKLDLEIPLYSEEIIKTPQDVVNLLASYMADLAHETAAVVCFDFEMRPMCVSLVGIGDFKETPMPVRNVIQTALLSNAAAIAVVHNHPDALVGKADLRASYKDVECVDLIMKACRMMGLQFYDSIIISSYRENGKIIPAYYSMREKNIKKWKKVRVDRYEEGIIKSTFTTENIMRWDDRDVSKYWGTDVTKLKEYPQITAYSPEELRQAVELIRSGAFGEYKQKQSKDILPNKPLNPDKDKQLQWQPIKKDAQASENTVAIPDFILKKQQELEESRRRSIEQEKRLMKMLNDSESEPEK